MDDVSGSDEDNDTKGGSHYGNSPDLSGTKRRFGSSNGPRGVPREVESASALFDDDNERVEDMRMNQNVDRAQDPFMFQDSDDEGYDEHRRHSLLSNRGEDDGSDSDNSVVPPSQSEGESDGGDSSTD